MDEKNPVSASAVEPTTIAHLAKVNTPSAETWNYLKVNDIALEVPSTEEATKELAALPAAYSAERKALAGASFVIGELKGSSAIKMGAGLEATTWIDANLKEERNIVVSADNASSPIEIHLKADELELARTSIEVEEGVSARVSLVVSADNNEATGWAAENLRIHLHKKAHLEMLAIVAIPEQAHLLDNIGVYLEKEANFELRQYLLGGATCALGVAAELAGAKSNFEVVTRYLVRNAQILDMNYDACLAGPESNANIDVTGVLHDGAIKSLRATIDLHHGGKNCSGAENETVLLAGENIVNKTLPTILCTEDDVAGQHGATIGAISPEQLTYLEQRGLSEEEAVRLYNRAIIDDAVEQADAFGKLCVLKVAERVLGAEIAAELAQDQGIDWSSAN